MSHKTFTYSPSGCDSYQDRIAVPKDADPKIHRYLSMICCWGGPDARWVDSKGDVWLSYEIPNPIVGRVRGRLRHNLGMTQVSEDW